MSVKAWWRQTGKSLVRNTAILCTLLILGGNLVVSSVFADGYPGCPDGMSQLDCDAILGGWVNWIPNDAASSGSCGAAVQAANAAEGENPKTVYAFFRAAGLDDMHAAAVYGNLYQESGGMDPTIMQKGGNSNNPADADPLGASGGDDVWRDHSRPRPVRGPTVRQDPTRRTRRGICSRIEGG